MARKPTGKPPGRPPSISSTQGLVAAKRRELVDQIRVVASNLPLPPVPTDPEHLGTWLTAVSDYLRSTTEMNYRLQIADLADTDPDRFLEMVSKNADIHMPKLGKVDQTVKMDVQTFVRVSERDEPLGMRQLPDGTWEPVFEQAS